MAMEERIRSRIRSLHESAPDSVGDLFRFSLESYDAEHQKFVFRCRTLGWMRNFAGTLHGGMCAAMLDQAFGFVNHCIKQSSGPAPLIQLQVKCHRPMELEEEIVVTVNVESVSSHLICLAGTCAHASEPNRICVTGNATSFNKGE